MILKLTQPKAARTISLEILLDTGITIAERSIVIALLTVPIKKITICCIYATGCFGRQAVSRANGHQRTENGQGICKSIEARCLPEIQDLKDVSQFYWESKAQAKISMLH